jgi:ABC-type methionine transport system ATPase subunit
MLLGLTRQQVDDRFDEIVAFAELENFIDTPVKFYSSGMFMRLGFAVAIFSEPDVLLVDEVLAVGDVVFQLKCFERMREIQERGTTIILVSHSMHAIRLLCPRVLVISEGKLEFDGDTSDAINVHFDLLSRQRHRDADTVDTLAVEVIDREIIGPTGPTHHLPYDGAATYRARLLFHRAVERPQIQLQVFTSGVFVYERRTISGLSRTFEPGEVVQIEVPFQQHLGAATFRFALNVLDNGGAPLYTDHLGLLVYAAPERPGATGLVDLEADIVVDGELQPVEAEMLLKARAPASAG